ncbi:hypothetical protein ES707_10586 [subsurface metagenome]
MTEFAKQLSVNPSTISRALADKYLESPWGIHKLKFFFTAAVAHTDKRIIFDKIKEIVEGLTLSCFANSVMVMGFK